MACPHKDHPITKDAALQQAAGLWGSVAFALLQIEHTVHGTVIHTRFVLVVYTCLLPCMPGACMKLDVRTQNKSNARLRKFPSSYKRLYSRKKGYSVHNLYNISYGCLLQIR